MIYTKETTAKITEQINKIITYIEKEIFPRLPQSYHTPTIYGDDTKFTIDINGPYKDKIRFSCHYAFYPLQDLPEKYPHFAVEVLKYWQDIKQYFLDEITANAETLKIINNFEV